MKLLHDFLETVVNGAKHGGPTLRESLTALDEMAVNPSSGLDPKLQHYLEKRSYTKAFYHLREMDDAESHKA